MFHIKLLRLNCVRRILFSRQINKCILSPNVNLHLKSTLNSLNVAKNASKTELLNLKSNSEKDKLLFYYENPRFYYLLNGFAFVQFFFWIHMAEFTYKKMKEVSAYEKENAEKQYWWQNVNFKEKSTRTMIATVCFTLGYVMLSMSWMYTLRSVRMLVLRKGGKTLSIVTYSPLGKSRTSEVPLEKVSAVLSRDAAKTHLPIKVQGKWLYYILDVRDGKFQNPVLFDYTAGMRRTFT